VTKQGGTGIVGRGVTLDGTTGSGLVKTMQDNAGNTSATLINFKPLDFTVEFSFKPTGDAMRLVLDAQSTYSFHGDWNSGGGIPYIGINQSGGDVGGPRMTPTNIGGSAPSIGEFHHFAFTFQDLLTGSGPSGDSGLAKYYVDSQLRATKTLTGIPDQANRSNWGTLNVTVGFVNGTGGVFDELAVYGYALNSDQIYTHAAIAGVPEPSSVALILCCVGGWMARRVRR
jgi:hypothetical protein